METSSNNQKNALVKLSEVLGIGPLISLGFKAKGHWIAEVSIKMQNILKAAQPSLNLTRVCIQSKN